MISMPKISVVTVTYGQENYIIEAIRGVLMQRFNGEIEYIIVNDNSPDDTDNIIRKFLSETVVPSNITITYIKHPKNKGAIPNFFWGIQQATGKYVAICEGDDYWIDPQKLQKQVDFLEENHACNLVYHRVKIFDDEKKTFDDEEINTSDKIEIKTLNDLAENGNLMHTPSVLFRNNIDIDTQFSESPVGDYNLWFLNGEKGNYAYLPDIMAVYRLSENSGWGKKSIFFRVYNWLNVLLILKNYTQDEKIRQALIKQALKHAKTVDLNELTDEEATLFTKRMNLFSPEFNKKIELKRNPLVSICIPTYNGEKYIKQSLDSVKNQTYKNIEVIISDDQSKDNTISICEKFRSEVDFPVHIYSHKPEGIGANWDHSVEKANGAFIKFLFQDDILEKNCLEEFLRLQEITNQDVFFCKRKLINDQGNPLDSEELKKIAKVIDLQSVIRLDIDDYYIFTKQDLNKLGCRYREELSHNFLGEPVASFVSKKAYEETGKHNPNLKQLLDLEYSLRLLENHNIVISEKKLIRFRVHDSQTTKVNQKNKVNENDFIAGFIVRKYSKYLNRQTLLKYYYIKYPIIGKIRALLPF